MPRREIRAAYFKNHAEHKYAVQTKFKFIIAKSGDAYSNQWVYGVNLL